MSRAAAHHCGHDAIAMPHDESRVDLQLAGVPRCGRPRCDGAVQRRFQRRGVVWLPVWRSSANGRGVFRGQRRFGARHSPLRLAALRPMCGALFNGVSHTICRSGTGRFGFTAAAGAENVQPPRARRGWCDHGRLFGRARFSDGEVAVAPRLCRHRRSRSAVVAAASAVAPQGGV